MQWRRHHRKHAANLIDDWIPTTTRKQWETRQHASNGKPARWWSWVLRRARVLLQEEDISISLSSWSKGAHHHAMQQYIQDMIHGQSSIISNLRAAHSPPCKDRQENNRHFDKTMLGATARMEHLYRQAGNGRNFQFRRGADHSSKSIGSPVCCCRMLHRLWYYLSAANGSCSFHWVRPLPDANCFWLSRICSVTL